MRLNSTGMHALIKRLTDLADFHRKQQRVRNILYSREGQLSLVCLS